MSGANRLAQRARVEPSIVTTQTPSKTSDVLGWAIPVYLLLLSGGFAFLRSPLATMRGNELSIDRAAFTVINAVTLTGFQQTIGLDELRAPGQIGVFVLMAGGTALALIIGANLLTRILNFSFSNRQIYAWTAGAIGVAALFGAASLGDTVLHGAFLGISALGNSGLFIGKVPASDALSTMMVLLPLAVAGGLGLPILLELTAALLKRRPLSAHSTVSLSIYCIAYLAGVGLLLTQLQADQFTSSGLAMCSAWAIGSRSAGFPMDSIAQFTRAGQWILAALMAMGAASGGTGGGLKGATLFVIFRGVRRTYCADRPGRAFPIAACWLAAYALLIAVGFLVLLECAPQMPGDRVLFLTISAASNVGWSHDPVSLVKSGLATLSIIMLLGRMMPIAVMWWMAKSANGSDLAVG